jgi:quinol monooxygenase YgiN
MKSMQSDEYQELVRELEDLIEAARGVLVVCYDEHQNEPHSITLVKSLEDLMSAASKANKR